MNNSPAITCFSANDVFIIRALRRPFQLLTVLTLAGLLAYTLQMALTGWFAIRRYHVSKVAYKKGTVLPELWSVFRSSRQPSKIVLSGAVREMLSITWSGGRYSTSSADLVRMGPYQATLGLSEKSAPGAVVKKEFVIGPAGEQLSEIKKRNKYL